MILVQKIGWSLINCKDFTCMGKALGLTVYRLQISLWSNNLTNVIYFIISYILNDTVHISGPFCVICKTCCFIVINNFILTNFFFCGFVINRILPLKNSCTHLQADNRVLVMPRGPLDILKKVLGMHAQVVTKPSLILGKCPVKGGRCPNVDLTLAHRQRPWSNINSSFTDCPLIILAPQTDFFLRRTPEVAPGHSRPTCHSYAHAHIAQIKNAREHCAHVTDDIKWLAIFNHACNGISPLQIMHVHIWISHKCEFAKGR